MGNYYSYKRISTDTERQNFNRQIKSLERYAKEHDIEYLIDFTEEKSAKNFTDRPQFKKLDKLLQAGDTVVFKDLYRFTREAENGYKKYMEWLDRGINMVFLDNPTVSSDYIRQMMTTAEQQDIVTKTAMESIIKLLIIVELTRLYATDTAISDGIDFYNLTDFSLVICKPDRKVIYSGCEWSGIQEDGELNATVAERVTLTAARRIETTA